MVGTTLIIALVYWIAAFLLFYFIFPNITFKPQLPGTPLWEGIPIVGGLSIPMMCKMAADAWEEENHPEETPFVDFLAFAKFIERYAGVRF